MICGRRSETREDLRRVPRFSGVVASASVEASVVVVVSGIVVVVVTTSFCPRPRPLPLPLLVSRFMDAVLMELLENLPEPLELVVWVTSALPADCGAFVVASCSSGL